MPVKFLSDRNTDGTSVGQAATDLINLYGGTPASQRASSNQASSVMVTSASVGTLQVAIIQEIMNTLTAIGAWKGAA